MGVVVCPWHLRERSSHSSNGLKSWHKERDATAVDDAVVSVPMGEFGTSGGRMRVFQNVGPERTTIELFFDEPGDARVGGVLFSNCRSEIVELQTLLDTALRRIDEVKKVGSINGISIATIEGTSAEIGVGSLGVESRLRISIRCRDQFYVCLSAHDRDLRRRGVLVFVPFAELAGLYSTVSKAADLVRDRGEVPLHRRRPVQPGGLTYKNSGHWTKDIFAVVALVAALALVWARCG